MVFDAAALAAKQAQAPSRAPFEFRGMDGELYELPPATDLTTRQAEQFAEGDLSVLEEVAEKDAVEAIRDMPIAVAEQLMMTWQRAAGTAGKSPTPSSSTPRNGKRRRRT